MPVVAPTANASSLVSRTEAPLSRTLFRAEIMEEHQSQWLGSVMLEPRASHRVIAMGAGIAALAVIGLLLFGSYTRKEHVSGWLMPQAGMIRVAAPQPGVITEIKVQEGSTVTAGEPLLVLSAEVQSQSTGPVREEVVQHLRERRDSLALERTAQTQLFDQQASDLSERIAALHSEQDHLAEEIEIQRQGVLLSGKIFTRLRPLLARGLITAPRLDAAEQDNLAQTAKLQTLEQNQANLRRALSELDGTLRQLPFQRSLQLAGVDRSVATVEQELAEAEARREIVVTAPQNGTITNLQATVGSTIETNVPLFNIVPSGSMLDARLFATSRAIGFIKPGQKVLLRYEAFPYQKFGFYEGAVATVSRSAMSPSELPQQAAGLSTLYGSNEPIYGISIDLAQQTATAYGNAMPLQAGMKVSADILIDRRRLIEWALDPLYSLTGGWR